MSDIQRVPFDVNSKQDIVQVLHVILDELIGT